MKKYDILVFICRIQPLHNAHLEIIKRATDLCKTLVVIIGSANQPRTYKNPFTSREREAMVWDAVSGLDISDCKIEVRHNPDTINDDNAWGQRIIKIVSEFYDFERPTNENIGLIGHIKDNSSFYLKMFPLWELESVELIEPLNATNIRDLYFRDDVNMKFIQGVVPPSTFDILNHFLDTDEYQYVLGQKKEIERYKTPYKSLPYKPVFVTVDALVRCESHILMVKRGGKLGYGLWALPGGFFDADDKSIEDAMLRELREETGIDVNEYTLRNNIEESRVFDARDRSERGRTISHAYYIDLYNWGGLPEVGASDDALEAKWIHVDNIKSNECFEDHYEIICYFLNKKV